MSYSCDTDLVLVGERLATCSPSLQWLPTSDDVMCIEPGVYSYLLLHFQHFALL